MGEVQSPNILNWYPFKENQKIKEIKNIATKYKTTKTINDNLNKILKDSAKTGAAIKAIKPFLKK